MAQIYFNVGRANRSGANNPYDFTTVNRITPDPVEIVTVELNLPTAQLTDPARRCRMEIYRSPDGVTWQFLGAATFVGDPENTVAPSLGFDGIVLNGFFLRARFLITGSMNVGFVVQSKSQGN